MNRLRSMKKRYMISIALMMIIALLFAYRTYAFTFQTSDDQEILQKDITSPNQQYTVSSYGIPYGGAAGGVMLQVEVTDTRTGSSKIIYRARAKTTTQLTWLNDTTLQITNESPDYGISYNTDLNVSNDIYEASGAACRSIPLKLSSYYTRCFQAES